MAELASLVLHLRAQHTDEVPVWLGRAAHAWFLESLECINPELSRIVHDENGLKPFTVSNPLPLQSREVTEIKRDTLYTLHLTTLHADVTQLTLHALVPRGWMKACGCMINLSRSSKSSVMKWSMNGQAQPLTRIYFISTHRQRVTWHGG